MSMGRREFLRLGALAAASAANGLSCIEIARAAPIEVPTVDELAIRVLGGLELRSVLSSGRSERSKDLSATASPRLPAFAA